MPSPVATSRATFSPHHRDQGFVIIMVIVVLILMLLLCTSYLRVIRLRAVPIRDEYAKPDVSLTSVIDLILQTTGKDKPLPAADPTTIQEPYDYPWTDQSRSSAWAALSYPVEKTSQTAAGDPLFDDAWLADAMPDPTLQRWTHLTNLRGSFLNYTDSDLANTPLNAFTGKRIPTDTLSNGTECPAGGIALDDPRLVDADGDGIGDSLWFYPPISRIGNTRFVAAVYIEDLSAKINLNTAFPQRDGSGSYGSLGNQPLGLSPCDVDAYALCTGLGCSSADLQRVVQFRTGSATFPLPAAWDAANGQHLHTSVSKARSLTGGPVNTADTRWNLWLLNGARCDSTAAPLSPDTRAGIWPSGKKYNIDSEVELRYRGSLNNAGVMADIESTSLGLGNSLRQSVIEASAAYSGNPWGLVPGKPKISGSNTVANLMKFFTDNPRRWITVVGGDCGMATGLPYFVSQNAGNPWYWSAWNSSNLGHGAWAEWNNTSPYYHQYTLAQCFKGADGSSPADDVNMPPGFTEMLKNTELIPNNYTTYAAAQMAVNLADYNDENNHISGAYSFYGMEALPFIREVYGQRKYTWAGGTYTAVKADGSDSAWAIEIVNPFNRPIKLTDVWLRMYNSANKWDAGGQTGTYVIGELSQLASTATGMATLTDSDGTIHMALPAGHRLVLVREASDAAAVSNVAALVTASTGTHTCVISNASAHTRWPGGIGKTLPGSAALNQGDATFELCARRDDNSDSGMKPGYTYTAAIGTSPGTYVWDGAYSAARVPQLPDTYAGAGGAAGWRRVDARARADLNVMQYRPIDFAVTGTDPNGTSYLSGGALTEELGDAGLSANLPAGAVDWAGDAATMYLNLHPGFGRYPDSGAMDHATELLDVPMAGPRLYNGSYRRKWGGANMLRDTVQATPAIHEDSYADALRVILTTDGTTLWNNPGKAGRAGHLDALTLRTDDQPGAVAADDIHYVDMSATANANNRIPHAIQLLRWLSPIAKASDWVDQNSTSFTSTGIDTNANGAITDLYSTLSPQEADDSEMFIPGRPNLNTMPFHVLRQALPFPAAADRDAYARMIVDRRSSPVAANGTATTNKNTRSATVRGLAYTSELLADTTTLASPGYARWLEEFASTRGDVFAAHILVQGYDADNFASGPVASQRVMLIVERASQTTPGGKASVLASFSY